MALGASDASDSRDDGTIKATLGSSLNVVYRNIENKEAINMNIEDDENIILGDVSGEPKSRHGTVAIIE
jgi:hypothetical protein